MSEEHTVKHSKDLKGRSCAPSGSISPCHFTNTDKDAKCSCLLIFISFSLISTAQKYLEILILFLKNSDSDFGLT